MGFERVTKRDGRAVPFDESKIQSAIAKAMAAVGEPDDGFAGEVAVVVRMTLEDRHGTGRTPHIEEIQDLVEQALIELGRGAAAKAYILYRDQRARVREALEREADEGPRRRGTPRVQVNDTGGESTWSKGRIVAALMREAELSRELAEKVAARVEERVFAAGLTRISTALVRELVDNELVGLGLETALRRQVSFGLPLYDLRRMIEAPSRAPEATRAAPGELLFEGPLEERVSAAVLRRFSLQEVLGEELSELVVAGDIEVHELGRPHSPLTVAVPSGVLLEDASPEGAFDLVADLAALAREVAHGVVLEDPGPAVSSLSNGRGGAGLGAWLRALTAAARGARRRIDLAGVGGARSPVLLRRLAFELARLPDDPLSPRLFVDERELEALVDGGEPEDLRAVDRLLVAGRLVPTWSGDGTRLVGPGCHRAPGERAAITCAGAVSINLARLGLRAGPWREDRLMELAAATIDRAVEALAKLAAFQSTDRSLAGRVSHAVSPVGLREALQTLGDGGVDPAQGARLLGMLGDALARAGAEQHVSVALSPFFGERAAARFAALDARLPHHGQKLLFDRGVGAGLEPGRPYTTGYRVAPRVGAPAGAAHAARTGWPDEARLCSTVAVGALHPLPSDPGRGDAAENLSVARAWLDFARLRAEPAPDLVFPAPRPDKGPALFPDPSLSSSGTDA